MLSMSEDSIRLIRSQTDKAMEAMAGGKSVKEILTQLYIQGLPDKSEKQGQMMAERIIRIVTEYTSDCGSAIENLNQWTNAKLDEMLADKTLEERCQTLFQLVNAFHTINAATLSEQMRDAGITTDEIISQLEDKKLNPDSVSTELEEELKAQVLEAMNQCNILIMQAGGIADLMEQISQSEDITRCVVDYGVKSADYKAIAAMIAYIAAKNGTIEDISPEVTLEEVTVGVCAAIEAQRIAAQVEAGNIAEDIARIMLTVLSLVAAFFIITKLIMAGFLLGYLLVHGFFGIVAGVLLGITVATTLGTVIIDMSVKASEIAADFIITTVFAVITGFRKLLSWSIETLLPSVIAGVKKGLKFAVGFISRGMTVLLSGSKKKATVNA